MKTFLKIKWKKKPARLRKFQPFERKAGCKLISNALLESLSISIALHTVTPTSHIILGQ